MAKQLNGLDGDFETLPEESEEQGQEQQEETTAAKGNTPGTKALNQLTQQIADVQNTVNGSVKLAEILSDPDIAKLMEAKRSGKKFRLMEEEQTAVPQGLPDNFAELSETDRAKVIMQHLNQQTANTVQQMLVPIAQRLQSIEGGLQNVESNNIVSQIEKVRQEFPDFDTFKSEMRTLNDSVQGKLSVRQLYLLARSQKTGVAREVRDTESERPSRTNGRVVRTLDPKKFARTSQGFQGALETALSKLDFPE